jgi:phage gp16-like protein
MSKLARNHRNSDIVKIHVAKNQLGFSDEDYRAILLRQGGASSSKDLDHAGRKQVLDYLQTLGFKPTAAAASKRPARPTPAPEKIKLVRKIRAQLISLNRLPDTYADGIAKQMFGLQFFEWGTSDQLHSIATALAVQQRKKGAQTS